METQPEGTLPEVAIKTVGPSALPIMPKGTADAFGLKAGLFFSLGKVTDD
jgi:hypothetical protein